MLKLQDLNAKTAGKCAQKVSMLRGSIFTRSLFGKPFTFDTHGWQIFRWWLLLLVASRDYEQHEEREAK